MPVGWDQLELLTSGAHWTISSAVDYLTSRASDPWQGYWVGGQSLTNAMVSMDFKAPAARKRKSRT